MLLLALLALPLMHDISSPDLKLLDLSNTVLLASPLLPSPLVSSPPPPTPPRSPYASSLLSSIHLSSQTSSNLNITTRRHRHLRGIPPAPLETSLPSHLARPQTSILTTPPRSQIRAGNQPLPRLRCHHSRPELHQNSQKRTATNGNTVSTLENRSLSARHASAQPHRATLAATQRAHSSAIASNKRR